MEAYKKTIKKRIYYYRFLMFVALALLVFVGLWSYKHLDSHDSSFTHGVQFGLAVGLFGGLIIQTRKCYKALRDNVQLRKMYIEETDERYKTINMKVNSATYYFMLYVMMCACIVGGFFNTTVSMTLIAVTLAMIALRGVFGIYYSRKY